MRLPPAILLLLACLPALSAADTCDDGTAPQARCIAGAAASPAGGDGGEEQGEDAGEEDAWSGLVPEAAAHFRRLDALPEAADAALERARIAEVMRDPVFGSRESRIDWQWSWHPWLQDKARDERSQSGAPAWLKDLVRGLSRLEIGALVKLLLWVALLALLLYALRHAGRLRGLLAARRPAPAAATVEELPVLPPETLPADVLEAARGWWARGNARAALSLLYRGALAALATRHGIAVPGSATEQECLRLVARHADADSTGAFRELVNAWMRSAWQHAAPGDFAPLADSFRRATGSLA